MIEAQQNLRIGEWQSHLPFRYGRSVTQSNDHIYFGTDWAILRINKEDLSNEMITKVEGLSDIGVKMVRYDKNREILLIIYQNSNIDFLLDDGMVINLNDIQSNNQIVQDKTIFQVRIAEEFAWIATGFGLVQLNLENREFGTTVFTPYAILDVAIFNNTIYLATDLGVYSKSADDSNLADFNTWNLLGPDHGFPSTYSSAFLETAHNQLFLDIDQVLYSWNEVQLQMQHEEVGFIPDYLVEIQDDVLVGWECISGCNSKKLLITPEREVTEFAFGCANRSAEALVDEENRLWLADNNTRYKYYDLDNGNCIQFGTNSPETIDVSDMTVNQGVLYVASGGRLPNYNPRNSNEGFYTNEGGKWRRFNKDNVELFDELNVEDFYRTTLGPDQAIYIGTFSRGMVKYQNEEFEVFDERNSSLQPSAVFDVNNKVTDLQFDVDGNLWMLNHEAPEPLSRLSNSGEWQSFSLPTNTNVESMLIDPFMNFWIVVGGNGLLVINFGDLGNSGDDQWRVFNSSNSALKTNSINDLVIDKDNNIWVASTQGPIIFSCATFAFEENCPSLSPIVLENGIPGELLSTENIRTIAIDGGNRKWFGTSNGVFVQSADAEEQLLRFTTDNSPLFDNTIIDIEIDPIDGVVFIATNKGIISYRGDATEGTLFQGKDIVAFPNPVRPEYNGPIAVRGLAEDAQINITDVSGNLVHQGRSTGGQFLWDGTDFNGKPVASGVYLVFSAKERSFQSPEGAVGKIMIIR